MDESEIRQHLCEILGLAPNATGEEIKKAYTVEAKKWHPDRVQHNNELAALAEKKLKVINQAYECLTDRAQFDRYAGKLAKEHAEATSASSAQAKATSSASSNASSSSKNTSSSSGSNSSTNGSNSGTQGSTASSTATAGTDKGGIVKIFLATGLFVLIVIIVANVSEPRSAPQPSPGITLSPSDSPGAPFSGSSSSQSQRTTLPSDSSVGPPPGSN
jgi:cobalamin biosynthesis Mg chelatase CobN